MGTISKIIGFIIGLYSIIGIVRGLFSAYVVATGSFLGNLNEFNIIHEIIENVTGVPYLIPILVILWYLFWLWVAYKLWKRP